MTSTNWFDLGEDLDPDYNLSDSSLLRNMAKNDTVPFHMIFPSATEGEGGYVFTPFCLSVCLSVYRISQKVVDG